MPSVERDLERLAEQSDKISFHAEYEEEEQAWRKVTPVGQFDSPARHSKSPDQSMKDKSSARNKIKLGPTNYSEGEGSSDEDDVDIIN